MQHDSTGPKVYRSLGHAVAAWVIGALFLGWMAVNVVIVIEAGKAAVGLPFIAAVALPTLWLVIRTAQAKVVVLRDGVVIQNIRRTRSVERSAIEKFVIGRSGLLPRVGIVALRDGQQITIWGIQGANPSTRPAPGQAERQIAELNRWLTERDQHR